MKKFLVVFGFVFLLMLSLSPLAHADSEANCFVNLYPPAPNDYPAANVVAGQRVTAWMGVACDDAFKNLLSPVTYTDGKCYSIEFFKDQIPLQKGTARLTDCMPARVSVDKELGGDGVYIQAGGDSSKLLGAWIALGGAVGPSAEVVPPASSPTGSQPATPGTPAAPSGSGSTTGVDPVTISPEALASYKTTTPDGKYYCGSNQGSEVHLSIDLGCVHKDPAILDLMFAIIRLLSTGVGIIVIASIVVAGIQYIWSRGNPQEVERAQERIRSSLIALLLFIFTYAILNWLVPAGLLK